MQVFKVLGRAGYQWIIRVDDDSRFPDPVPYNLVKAMQQEGASYGFRVQMAEDPPVVHSLAEATKFWLTMERREPAWLYEHCNPSSIEGLSSLGWSRKMFYNNFFVGNISFWLAPEVQGYLRFLEQIRGAHRFRWGDAPVQTLTAGIFLPKQQIMEFDFAYEHQLKWGWDVFSSDFRHYKHKGSL